MSPLQIYFC